MSRFIVPAIVVLALSAGPALAGHCPKDAAAVDAALAKVTIGDEAKAEVMSLRDKGMELHEAGNHAESEATLSEAMRLLLNSI